MPRLRDEIIVRPPRNRRIIIYVNELNERKWRKLFIDMKARNYEEALMKLLDIYELLVTYLQETSLDKLKEN
jgi:hypothetical protein